MSTRPYDSTLRECLKTSARLQTFPCGECAWCVAHPVESGLSDPYRAVAFASEGPEQHADSLNRDVVDPEQPGASFWPSTVEEHRVLLAKLEAELKAALATIRALHRCPHCDRPLTAAGEAR